MGVLEYELLILTNAQDTKADDVAPRWPAPLQEDGSELVYDLVSIPSESISVITKFTMKDVSKRTLYLHIALHITA